MARLRDEQARARINARIDRLAHGNAGDAMPIGGGVSELRIHYGPGYRVYFTKIGLEIVLLAVVTSHRKPRISLRPRL